MIPAINIPPAAKSAAKEAAEDLLKAFQSFNTQVSCTDLSAIQDCTPLNNGGSSGDGTVKLDWRSDPFVSMSDLTLVVYDGGSSSSSAQQQQLGSNGNGTHYHVHTLLLAYGGRKSGFIADQIKNNSNKIRNNSNSNRRKNNNSNFNSSNIIYRQTSEASNESSTNSNAEYKIDIYIPSLAAKHIPTFLDYIYGSELILNTNLITTLNAPSLRYLSNKFDIRTLHQQITNKFIPRDLEINTACSYCNDADESSDYELRNKSIQLLADKFFKVNVNDLAKWLHPRLMRSLLQCDRLDCGSDNDSSSEALSEKVAQYIRLRDDNSTTTKSSSSSKLSSSSSKHRILHTTNEKQQQQKQQSLLSDEDFYWLTHVQHMPKISPKEALFYYNYGTTHYPQVMNDEIGSGSLKSRCLLACSSSSSALDRLISHLEHSDHNPLDTYENLELKMKVQLLESTLVGTRKLMIEKERQCTQSNGVDRDVQLSNDIMYRNNKECSTISSSSSSNNGNSSCNVMKVIVLGCGVAPANGIYIYKGSPNGSGNFNSTIVYKKEAIWNGQQVTFVIYSTNSGQFYSQYKLSVRDANDRTRILYNSPTVTSSSSSSTTNGAVTIPEMGWNVENDDASVNTFDEVDGHMLHPPPQFVGRVEQQQQQQPTWKKNMKHSMP